MTAVPILEVLAERWSPRAFTPQLVEHDKLLALSCKGRGLGPSCGARRMSQTAAHLVDHVITHVPVRHWVLSLPNTLRLLLAE